MGASVINNSTSIHSYRGQIAQAIENLQTQFNKTESALESVHEAGWKDDNFREFQNNFNEDKEKILPLCNVLDNYQGNLLYQLEQKLKRLEDRRFSL